MRQTSTIELTDVTSAEPRQSKRPRIPATTAETCPAAHNRTGLTTDDSSTSTTAGQNDLATAHLAGSAADGNTAPTADGRAHHAAHESRDSCPDHRHDALTADGHANLDADPRTDPDATADTSLPPRGDAPCAHAEDDQDQHQASVRKHSRTGATEGRRIVRPVPPVVQRHFLLSVSPIRRLTRA